MTAPMVADHFAAHLCGECELDEELTLADFTSKNNASESGWMGAD